MCFPLYSQKHLSKLFLSIFLLPFLASASQAKADLTNDDRYQLLLQIKSTRQEIKRADAVMVNRMGQVLKELKTFVAIKAKEKNSIGLLPSHAKENKSLERYLANDIGINPYRRLLNPNRIDDSFKKVTVKLDSSISPYSLNSYRQNPPKSWHASAGTITILHNGYDFALVWGADINGLPVKNKRTKRIKIKSLKLKL